MIVYKQHKEICKDVNNSFGQCEKYTYYIELEYVYYPDFPIYKTNLPLDWKMYEVVNLKGWSKVENEFGLIKQKDVVLLMFGLIMSILFGPLIIVTLHTLCT